MKTTAENLAKSKSHILKVWEKEVRSSLPGARHESKPALRNHIPEFIDYVVEALNVGFADVRPEILSFAHHHGAERATLSQYTIEEALAEYNILRKIIFVHLEEAGPLTPVERDIIFESINIGLSKAAAEFTKLQMKQLAESSNRLRHITDIQPLLIGQLDKNFHYIFVNKSYEEWFGLPLNKIIGMHMKDVIGEEAFEQVLPCFEKAFSGEKVTFDTHINYKDQVQKYVYATYSPGYNSQGEIDSVFISVVDMTDERKTLEALQRSEQEFRLLADALPQLVWVADSNGKIEWFNQQYYRYTGMTKEEIKNNGWMKTHHPDYLDEGLVKFHHHIKSGLVWEDTFPIRSSAGEWRWFLSRAIPIKDMNGKITRWIGTSTDITTHKETLDALQEETILREKFVSTLSHDLRTPLTAAKMSAELIKRKTKDDPIINLSVRISESLNRANIMIEDLLDASKIRAGQAMHPDIRHFDIVELIQKTLEDLTSIHGDRFLLQHPSSLQVDLDPQAIRRILENLCTNAIKYGAPNEKIKISMAYGTHKLMICVHNEGNPLLNIDKVKLFEPFQRGPATSVAGKKGWGIGLTIVKGLTDALQGEVNLDTSQEGTTFKITLPLQLKSSLEESPRIN